MARAWRDHPFIYVPEVLTRLSSEHVLVTEWVDGIGFEEVRTLDQATRDRFGEIVFRFFFGSLYRNGHFSGDPHPGNQLLMADGRVAFLDFGMTKQLPREQIDMEMEALRRGHRGRRRGPARADGGARLLRRRRRARSRPRRCCSSSRTRPSGTARTARSRSAASSSAAS